MSLRKSLVATAVTISLAALAAGAAHADVAIGVSINVAPPELPVYEQPPIPGPGYIWTPGYWAWGGEDYYWVPGTWVLAPQPGYLWTPGYWGWADGVYLWHEGYWGPHVGFYGGVDYGYGYPGEGFHGGEWRGGRFFYNRSAANIPPSVHITNVYNQTVVNNITVNRVSYNGGNGGVAARPSQAELSAEHEHHLARVSGQVRQEQAARSQPELHANANHGAPTIAATARPGSFKGAGVVAARGAPARHGGEPAHAEPAHTETAHGGAGPVAPHAGPPAPHDSGAAAEARAAAAPRAAPHPNVAQPQAHSFRPEQPGGGPAGAGTPHAVPEPQVRAEPHGPPAHASAEPHGPPPAHAPAEHAPAPHAEQGHDERGHEQH
jgi:hypothetical protein